MASNNREQIIISAVPYEKDWAKKWSEAKIFEVDPDPSKPKFFICVPYSYQNGPLHIGHGFTFTRGDAYARFKRMQGYNVLFPWAWHWTGEAVAGTSERLKQGDQLIRKVLVEIDGVPPEIVDKFIDPAYISRYYTEENKKVVRAMGYSIDFRREFYTTDLHPYYSKFITWQYLTLKERGYVITGKHPVVWCPRCHSPTGDHDRLVGEGVSPEEYTLVYFKMEDVYLAAATLRPETIFGVTNIWINPHAPYLTIEMGGKKLLVSKRAAEKLSEQKKEVRVLGEVDPRTFIGKMVETPIVNYTVPILPAEFVDPNFGSGVVYSVPGHAPYDYAGLITLKKRLIERDEYDIRRIVEEIKPTSIIRVPDYGEYPAVEIVERLRIVDDRDPRLDEATREIYSKEFHSGVMKKNCREFSDLSVNEARERVKQKLLEEGLGDIMWEVPDRVVCRCSTECLVKIVEDQWFLKYSDQEWKNKVKEHISTMKIYPEEARQWFINVVDWLRDWACARKTGLGTKLPWDPEWIVETLSDSTIYPALYTISKYLNDGRVKPEQLTVEVLNYIFLGEGETAKLAIKSRIDKKLLKMMRDEFLYWYPVDMRISAKELVPNHLTFYLFHHIAIFEREHWPRGISVNGMITIEGEKMSKSRGKFIPLKNSIAKYGADTTRCTLLLAAEDMDDPDWREKNAQEVKLMLEQFLRIVKEVSEAQLVDQNSVDRWLLSRLQERIKNITSNMDSLKTRKACHEALYGMYADWRWYLRRTGGTISKNGRIFVENWVKLLAPFAPFTCEEAWKILGKDTFISTESWPIIVRELVNLEVELAEELIIKLIEDVRSIVEVLEKKPSRIIIYVASEDKQELLEEALSMIREGGQKDLGKLIKKIIVKIPGREKLAPNMARILLDTASYFISNYKPKTILEVAKIEEEVIRSAIPFLSKELTTIVEVYREGSKDLYDPMEKALTSLPLRPGIYVE
ncbi:MAG: leucine--tRNA ligase [Nitrososphaerota archaeon]|nr:leucine--tRNA ligase [Nitrososphaerota archaeon]